MNTRNLGALLIVGMVAIPIFGIQSIGCGTSVAGGDAGTDAGDGGADAGDGGIDAGSDAGTFARTLISRPLMATSPQNLLRDPLLGGEGTGNQFGQVAAFYNSTPPALLIMNRTFQSVSPVGGSVVIEELGNFAIPDGGTAVSVLGPVLGGGGAYHASIWISAGDAQGNAIPFASAANAIEVTLDVGGDAGTDYPLSPTDAGVVTYGTRQWVQFALTDDAALPIGGYLDVTLNDLTKTLHLTAPEVTNSLLGARASGKPARSVPITASKARMLEQVRALPPSQ